jgi:chromosome segregation ATPase
MKDTKYVIILIIGLFSITNLGCDLFFDRQQARKTVLAEDPSFASILQERDKIKSRMDKAEEALKEKKKELNSAIKELKEAFSKENKKISLEIKNLENNLNKYRDEIKLDLKKLTQELKAKKKILKNTESTIKEANKLLTEDAHAQLTSQKETGWDDKLKQLSRQRDDIVEQIDQLNEEIRVEKLKLKLLN